MCGSNLTIWPGVWKNCFSEPNADGIPSKLDIQKTLPLIPCKKLDRHLAPVPGYVRLKLVMNPIKPRIPDEGAKKKKNEKKKEMENADKKVEDEEKVDPPTPIDAQPDERYRLIVHVYQAKDVPGDPFSTLSNLIVVASLQNCSMASTIKPRCNHCFWFEELDSYSNRFWRNAGCDRKQPAEFDLKPPALYLPSNVGSIPDIKFQVFNVQDDKKWVYRGGFSLSPRMGDRKLSPKQFYPLLYESESRGELMVSFMLIPARALEDVDDRERFFSWEPARVKAAAQKRMQYELKNEKEWDTYSVSIYGLAVQGELGLELDKLGAVPRYLIKSCWGTSVSVLASEATKSPQTLEVTVHRDQIFWSFFQILVYDGDDVKGVCTLPASRLLTKKKAWHNLFKLVARELLPKKIFRKWIHSVNGDDRGADGDSESKKEVPKLNQKGALGALFYAKQARQYDDNGDEDFAAEQIREIDKLIKNGPDLYQEQHNMDKCKVHKDTLLVKTDMTKPLPFPAQEESFAPFRSERSLSTLKCEWRAMQNFNMPSNVCDVENYGKTEKGLSALDVMYLCPEPNCQHKICSSCLVYAEDNKHAEHPFFRHWVTQHNYEDLPLVKPPFDQMDVHGLTRTNLLGETLSIQESVLPRGIVRANVYALKVPGPGDLRIEKAPPNDFDKKLYSTKEKFCVRVYLTKITGINLPKGTVVYLSAKIGNYAPHIFTGQVAAGLGDSSEVKVFKRFDFHHVSFPDVNAKLEVCLEQVEATGTSKTKMNTKPLGKTTCLLENLLYSRQWQKGRRPLENRSLYHQRARMGTAGVCVDILPQKAAGLPGPPDPDHFFDYLLRPPIEVEWHLRIVIYNCQVYPTQVNLAHDSSFLTRAFSIPDYSHLCVYTSLMAPTKTVQHTQVHNWAYGGQAVFNERHLHRFMWPTAKPWTNLKIQVFHTAKPDDPLCEAVMPLWNLCKTAVTEWKLLENEGESKKELRDGYTYPVRRTTISLSHPNLPLQQGKIELSLQLLPATVSTTPENAAKFGSESWAPVSQDNAQKNFLPSPNSSRAPEDRMVWYRIDLLMRYRCGHFMFHMWPIWLVLVIAGGIVLAGLRDIIFP